MLLDENTASVNHLYTKRDRFRDPVCARGPGTPTARSWYAKYPAAQGIRRRAARPFLFARCSAPATRRFIRRSWRTRPPNADDYTLETVDASHFVIDERPDLVRAKLIALAEEMSR